MPIRFLYGTVAEINFWDIIYYKAYKNNGSFDTSTSELATRTDLSRQMISKLRHQAREKGELREDSSLVSGRRFVLTIPDFKHLKKGLVWKPVQYIHNGWYQVITPAIPKRVLNLFFQQPRQSVYRLPLQYIAAKCKRRFLHKDKAPATPLNVADVGKALRLLVRLGLLTPKDDGYRIEWQRFDQAASETLPLFDDPDPHQHPAFHQAARVDAQRAERALEIADIGHYDFDRHFTEIFRDLIYIRGEEYSHLIAKVKRYRHRPPGENRWRDTWKSFQRTQQRRELREKSSKYRINLDEGISISNPLFWDILQPINQIRAVWLVSRLEWPWHFEIKPPAPSLKLQLQLKQSTIHQWTVTPGDLEKRYLLSSNIWHALKMENAPLVLNVVCDKPLPGFHIEAWLEAYVWK